VTDPRIHARRVGVERQRGRRRLGILLGALVVAGLAAGSLAVLHTSLFGARTVIIAGAVHTNKAEILAVTGLDRRPPLVDVNDATLARRLERLPWVAVASVHADWPSTVAVALVERIAVATTPLPKGGYAILDATGRVLGVQATRPVNLPLVSLPQVPGLPGSSLGLSARPLLDAAAAFPVSLLPRLEQIETSGSDGIVLKLTGAMLAVVGDDTALADKYISLATVLGKVKLAGIGAIDLRVPAAPVLTPLVSPSIVDGKGDG
jgi:cell division protein FtsQ